MSNRSMSTSYSTFAVDRIRLVDGDLPTDREKAEEAIHSFTQCVASGAARSLLDASVDQNGTPQSAEDWHSEAEGWELEALDDESRRALEWFAEQLVATQFPYLVVLTNWLAFKDRASEPPEWFHDFGLSLYRCGQLFGAALGNTSAKRFEDYHHPVAYKLDDWVSECAMVAAVVTRVDTTQEPCLLHLVVEPGFRAEIGA